MSLPNNIATATKGLDRSDSVLCARPWQAGRQPKSDRCGAARLCDVDTNLILSIAGGYGTGLTAQFLPLSEEEKAELEAAADS